MASNSYLEIVNRYIKYRKESNRDEVLKLCSDNIIFTDPNGRVLMFKQDFSNYLKEPTPESEWEVPILVGKDKVTLNGKVNKMWMWWNVLVTFEFDVNNKISSIVISSG
jgi:hypothetical protein